jgi:Hemerythrin HHE cation binding domain
MSAELHAFLAGDHERLDALLEELSRGEGRIPHDRYDKFRRGLLRHIGIEERVLFPELRKRRGVTSLEKQLHRDHAALAALLVPPPTHAEIQQIRAILESHNELEEEPGGLYEIIEEIAAEELPALMARVHAIPAIPVAPFSDTPLLRQTIAQLLKERCEKDASPL